MTLHRPADPPQILEGDGATLAFIAGSLPRTDDIVRRRLVLPDGEGRQGVATCGGQGNAREPASTMLTILRHAWATSRNDWSHSIGRIA